MGLFLSIVVLSLTLVIALAIAAAASTPRSVEIGDDLSLALQVPPGTASALNKAPTARERLTSAHARPNAAGDAPASTPSSSLDSVAPPMLLAAGLP